MWTTSGLLLQLMASYAAIQVVESQTALTLPSSPPPPPPPPELNFILFLPFSVPDYGWNYTQGHLYAEVASFNAAAEAAVDDGTSIPPSLQGVRINMIKVNMWDPEFTSPDLFPIVDSGGYASAALYDAIIGKPVAGIIGDVYSRTTIFTAGVASQLKVPFCGATQASPRLADRRNYGYFFRMEVGEGYGSFTANLLHRFEVNRVILVAGTDTFSASVSKDVEKGLREGGILIAASVRITSDVIVSKKFDHILSTIARHNIRYIFVSLLPEDISGFYYAAAKYGLTGPNYVWMGLNAPIVTPNDPDMEWKLAVGEGFLISTPMYPSESMPYERYKKKFWKQMNKTHPLWFEEAKGNPGFSGGQVFDCVKTMLYGFDAVRNFLFLTWFPVFSRH
ncbi:periplasmic binding protein-like I [Chytridium lagenaria]|nr:periplasmic binding protein-like I [Chytridium lagenaria]